MRKVLALITFTLMAFVGLGASPSQADDVDNEIGSCLTQGQVWLLVVTEDGEPLANQCVGNPTSGEQALADGGIRMQFDKGRMICSMSDHPATCPATFDGSYWAYFQGAPGQEYSYSELGPQASKPEGGAIEAWCFATAEAKECTPPQLNIVQGGQQVAPPTGTTVTDLPVTQNAAVSIPGGTPWALIITGVAVVLVVAALVVVQRRRRSAGPKATGGR